MYISVQTETHRDRESERERDMFPAIQLLKEIVVVVVKKRAGVVALCVCVCCCGGGQSEACGYAFNSIHPPLIHLHSSIFSSYFIHPLFSHLYPSKCHPTPSIHLSVICIHPYCIHPRANLCETRSNQILAKLHYYYKCSYVELCKRSNNLDKDIRWLT